MQRRAWPDKSATPDLDLNVKVARDVSAQRAVEFEHFVKSIVSLNW